MRLEYAIIPLNQAKPAQPFSSSPSWKSAVFSGKENTHLVHPFLLLPRARSPASDVNAHRRRACELDPDVLDLYSSWVSAVLCCVRCSHALRVCNTETHFAIQDDRIVIVFGVRGHSDIPIIELRRIGLSSEFL